MKSDILAAVIEARAAKMPAALVTDLESGAQSFIAEGAPPGEITMTEALQVFAGHALADDRGATLDVGGKRYFIQVFNPPRRLIVIGAVHITQTLAPMAALSGYAVSVIDPRGAFATGARFPGVELIHEWPAEAMEALDIDRRTAIVTLTHDPKLDDPALRVALGRQPFYIGCLGSRKTHAGRLQRLREAGFDGDALARLHGPIGLDIGAISPAEISLAILGEMTKVLHARPAEAAA
jgi:xanthine dehydrogenase accessory factor